MSKQQFIGPSEVAELLNVNAMTVRRMSDKGLLPYSVTPGGHRRYKATDVDEYCQKNGIKTRSKKITERKILIVDDDQQILDLLVLFTKSIDPKIRIEVAVDGFKAGLKVMEFEPQVIVTDIMMPNVDGIEVCKHIKKSGATRDIKVVGITGTDDQVLINQFLNAGGHSCLFKPLNKKKYTDLLKELL